MHERDSFIGPQTRYMIDEDAAIEWLLHSGIRNHADGSIFDSYDLLLDRYRFSYTEITAYFVNLMVYLAGKKNQEFLRYARKAVEWMCSKQLEQGPFICHVMANGKASPYLYTFDIGVCVSALVDYATATHDSLFLGAALKAGNWIISSAQEKDGSIKTVFELSNNGIVPVSYARGKWYWFPGPYHGKVAIGLLKLYKATGDERFLESGSRLSKYVASHQLGEGGFAVNFARHNVFSHVHCYALEGLAWASVYEERFLEPLMKGCQWLMSNRLTTGPIIDWSQRRWLRMIDVAALAQMVRILELTSRRLGDASYHSAASKALDYLRLLQRRDGRRRVQGSFPLLSADLIFPVSYPRFYSWSTIFAIHASATYRDSEADFKSLW